MTNTVADPTKRVLIVDDELPILKAVSEYFTAYGLYVDAASEREEAEALLSAYPYDLVIADMRLTGIHGREGLELVRYVQETRPRAKTIVLTAHGTGELELEVRRGGADRFLLKPIALSALAAEAFEVMEMEPFEIVWARRRQGMS